MAGDYYRRTAASGKRVGGGLVACTATALIEAGPRFLRYCSCTWFAVTRPFSVGPRTLIAEPDLMSEQEPTMPFGRRTGVPLPMTTTNVNPLLLRMSNCPSQAVPEVTNPVFTAMKTKPSLPQPAVKTDRRSMAAEMPIAQRLRIVVMRQ